MAQHSQTDPAILILDDDPNVVRALKRVLTSLKVDLHCYHRPLDAMELLQHQPVNLLIVDQCMPQMEGSHFLQRAQELHPDTPAILLTGYSEEREKRALEASGLVWRYLSKPWDDQQIRGLAAEALERSALAS